MAFRAVYPQGGSSPAQNQLLSHYLYQACKERSIVLVGMLF